MLKGFIRTTRAGPSVKRQKAAMIAAGFDFDDPYVPVYTDNRTLAIASLEKGDILAVATAQCLGNPESDVIEALKMVGQRGATVLDIEANENVSWHPDAQVVLSFAVRAGSDNRKAIAAKARKGRVASGNLGGVRAIIWDSAKLALIKSLHDAGTPRQEMADQLGISRPTLQRKLRELGLNHSSNKSADK